MTAPGAGTPAATTPGRAAQVMPEQAARAAYQAHWTHISGFVITPWDELSPTEQGGWASALQAGIAAAHAKAPEQVGAIAGAVAGQIARERDEYREERDSLTGRVAELVAEGNELRGLVAEILGVIEGGFDGTRNIGNISESSAAIWRQRAGLGGSPDGA